MTVHDVQRICDALRERRRGEARGIISRVEDGTASVEDRAEFSRWLNHARGIVDAEVAVMEYLTTPRS